jgi:ribonuclease P protein component
MARFTKSQRLLKRREFDAVLSGSNTKVVCRDFVLLASVDQDHVRRCRLGLIVSGKVGNAVIRNRVKRSIRSLFQSELSEASALVGRDLVVIARPALVDQEGQIKTNIQESLRKCAERLVNKLNFK